MQDGYATNEHIIFVSKEDILELWINTSLLYFNFQAGMSILHITCSKGGEDNGTREDNLYFSAILGKK